MYTKTSPRIDAGLNNPMQRASRGSSVDRDDLELNGNGHSQSNNHTNQPLLRRNRSDSPRGKSKASRCQFFDSQTRYGNTAYLISLAINVVLLIVICLSFYQSNNQCLSENPLVDRNVDVGVTDLSNEMVVPPVIVDDRDRDEEDTNQQAIKNQQKPSIIEPVAQPDLDEEPVNRPPVKQEEKPVEPIMPPQPPVQQKKPSVDETTKSDDKSDKPSLDQPNHHKGLSPSLIQPGEGGNRAFFVDDASDHLGPDAHRVEWDYCLSQSESTPVIDGYFRNSYNLTWQTFPFEACTLNPTGEQSWQITWYGGQVAVGVTERQFPMPPRCVNIPPVNYEWPHKYTALPAVDQSFFHWKNLRVEKYEDLIVFNPGTPKNLYHFEAPRYDLDGLEELALAAQHIPFASKIRTFLDIGAGGASLGLLMRRKYRVETISVIFPDWPYCEYITERGGLCVLVDAMEAMPFARGAFDVIHISWVYHGQHPHELIAMFMEIDRLVRPGGYVWQRGGFSMQQVYAMKHLFKLLGYTALHDKLKRVDREKVRIQFGSEGDIPFEAEWSCIFVKPTTAVKEIGCSEEHVPEYGTTVTPARV